MAILSVFTQVEKIIRRHNKKMYQLISVNDAMMTRDVWLKNLETGTVDFCFDDSAVVDDKNNFEFMEIGKTYDCKIELFGEKIGKSEKSTICQVLERNVKVGDGLMVKLKVDADIYYIPENKLRGYGDVKVIDYYYTRKDLIQVDQVVHGDLLND